MKTRLKQPLLRRFLSGFIVAYFFLGMLSLATPQREIFPFFSWFLFPFTPNPGSSYHLLILEYGGKTVDPPLYHRELPFQTRNIADIDLYTTVQRLGKALDSGDQKRVEKLTILIEEKFLTLPVRYHVMQITSDPVEEFLTGQREDRFIATFSSQGEDP